MAGNGHRVERIRIEMRNGRVGLIHILQAYHGKHDVLQIARNVDGAGVGKTQLAIGRLHLSEAGAEGGCGSCRSSRAPRAAS